MARPSLDAVEQELKLNFEKLSPNGQWNPDFKYKSLGEVEEQGRLDPKKKWLVESAKNQGDLVRIGRFLVAEDETGFWQGIAKLEAAMAKLFKDRMPSWGGATPSFAHGRTNIASEGVDPTKHLLTEVLTVHENAEKFREVGRGGDNFFHPMSFWGVLGNAAFAASIRGKMLGKDYVAGDHGEYSHRIQWYCIGVMKGDLGLRSQDMGTLFGRSGLAWALLFDRAGNLVVDDCDFRRPEKLNRHLTDKAQSKGGTKYPLLNAFLQARANKMGSAFTLQLKMLKVAKRMHGTPLPDNFNTLSMTQVKEYLRSKSVDPVEIEKFLLRGGVKVLGGDNRPLTLA